MSRIGKVPIPVPSGVNVTITPDMQVSVKGPKGQMAIDTQKRVVVKLEDNALHVARPDDTRQSRAYHGLYQRLLRSFVTGVTEGFRKELEIQGVGYRAAAQGKSITLALGYSHPIQFDPPEGITLEVPAPTSIIVSGCDKQAVGQVAANIRELRPPEPYQGKGIRYKNEQVRRKVGKTGA